MTKIRKVILKAKLFRILYVELCKKVIESKVFEYFVLAVIILNSVYLAFDDYSFESNYNPTIVRVRNNIENTFSTLYIIEFLIKVSALGFILKKDSYMRDYWNLIDLVIICQVIVTWILEGLGINNSVKLNALRAFRILIPLKSLRNIEGLRILVISLIHAIPLLRDSFIILGFFFLIFALAGLHHFHGDFKNRCFY